MKAMNHPLFVWLAALVVCALVFFLLLSIFSRGCDLIPGNLSINDAQRDLCNLVTFVVSGITALVAGGLTVLMFRQR